MNLNFFVFAFVNTLGSFHLGYSLIYLSSCLQQTLGNFGVADKDKDVVAGQLISIIPAGAMFGSLFSALLSRIFTKRECFIYSDLMNIFGTLLIFSDNLYVFQIGRLIQGIYTGLSSVLNFKFLMECVKQADFTQSMFFISMQIQIAFTIGIALALFMPAEYDAKSITYMYIYSVLLFTSVLRLLYNVVVLRYETPLECVRRGQPDVALEGLKVIYGSRALAQEVLQEMKIKVNSKSEEQKSAIGKLFVGIMIMVLQQISGINAINFYSHEVFSTVISDVVISRYISLFFALLGPLASMLTPYLVTRYGNKQTMVYGGHFITGILLAMTYFSMQENDLSSYFGQINAFCNIFFIVLYNFVFSATLSPCSWNICGITLSDSQMSVVSCSNWISTALVSFIFPIMLTKLGLTGCFLFFGVSCFAGSFFTQLFVEDERKLKIQ